MVMKNTQVYWHADILCRDKVVRAVDFKHFIHNKSLFSFDPDPDPAALQPDRPGRQGRDHPLHRRRVARP